MCCRAVQALLVVMVVVVGCVGPSVATPPPRTHAHSQQQTLQDIAENETMDSTCLRLMEEKVIPSLQAMEEQIAAMQEAIGVQQSGEERPFLDINHNDTNPSLGSQYKVLYGSRGSLSPSFPQFYQNGVRYEWRVVLPHGTRPVFTWEFIDMEGCCNCDYVRISDSYVMESPAICGTRIPAEDSHPMYKLTSNEFSVVFRTDGSVTGRGFILHYTAELAPHYTDDLLPFVEGGDYGDFERYSI